MYNLFNMYTNVYTSKYLLESSSIGMLSSKMSISLSKSNTTVCPEPNSSVTITDCFITGKSCQIEIGHFFFL